MPKVSLVTRLKASQFHGTNACVVCSKVSSHCPNRGLLWEFYGSLDAVSQLPDTVTKLGLSISSAEESRAVSALKTWQRVYHLREWREKKSCWAKGFDYNRKKYFFLLFTI